MIYEGVGKKITDMSVSKTKKVQKDFILLLNYLDFMETIGYLNNKPRRKISSKKLSALCGENLRLNYLAFSNYINEVKELRNKKYCEYFEKLNESLKDAE